MLVVLAAVTVAAFPALAEAVGTVATQVPSLPPLLALVLALAFRQPRVILAVLLLAATGAALDHGSVPAGFSPDLNPYIAAVISILLPLNLAALATLGDHRVLSPVGVLRLAAVATEVIIATGIWLHHGSAATATLERPLVAALGAGVGHLGQIGLATGAIGIAIGGVMTIRRQSAIEGGLTAAVFAGVLALTVSGQRPLLLAAASGALAAGVVLEASGSAFRDRLTDLPGRRSFEADSADLTPPFAVAMADLDHFKQVNDSHGHDVGDQVLRMVAAHFRTIAGGRAFRIGGEEFAVIFPQMTTAAASKPLEKLRAAVAAAGFALRAPDRPSTRPDPPPARAARPRILNVTISIGLADSSGTGAGFAAVLRRADAALYKAKESGRNKVVTG
ncbi:MAG: GGDEF domain-containing protein [Acidobacteria bacterium]|nr:GGDEF domain-containing protein [Acidobacteriota bacterium]